MNDIDGLIARTQRTLTYVYCVLIAITLCAFLFLPRPIDDATKSLLTIVLTALLALAQQSSSFWFARPRSAGIPDPTVTTSTTTVTPDSATTVSTVHPASGP